MRPSRKIVLLGGSIGIVAAALTGGFGLGVWLGPRLHKPVAPPASQARIVYTPTTFAALDGWADDALHEALPALQNSCAALAKRDPDAIIGQDAIARPAKLWQSACDQVLQANDDATLRTVLARVFEAFSVAAAAPDGDRGLFTGYYETELTGALTRDQRFKYPIYGVPRDLVTVDLSAFVPALPAAMPREIVGRVAGVHDRPALVPYFTRAQIDAENAVAASADVLAWADDPVAVHILHIQGSGRMTLPDGSRLRIGFAGSNGRQFRGIGSILIAAGVLKASEASMDKVRAWLTAHPAEARAYMDQNSRYIFFQRRPDSGDAGPMGALNVPLTPGRSLAVDATAIPLGAPLWLETADPDGAPLRRLVLAQDTGAAITGAVRGDLFWGLGEPAFLKAARMRSRGRYIVLVPRP